MEKLQACVSRLLTWLRRLPGWFQVHLSHLTRVRGIRQRWLMNSVSFLVMVLAVVVIVFGLIVKNYYDSSILSDMESKASTAVNYFSSTSSNYNSADGDYLSAAQDYGRQTAARANNILFFFIIHSIFHYERIKRCAKKVKFLLSTD